MPPAIAILIPSKPEWKLRTKGVRQLGSLNALTSGKTKESLLVPTTHEVAHEIALRDADGLRDRILTLTCPWYVIDALEDKERLFHHAQRLGLTRSLPRHYATASQCRFPCIVKPSDGVFGAGVTIANDARELRAWMKRFAATTRWVFQEYVPGPVEYSTLLVVVRGKIKAAMRSAYTYDGDVYVWPHAEQVDYRFSRRLPKAESSVFARLLGAYTGICNVNYKLVDGGLPKILEFNMRLGADSGDVPADELYRFLQVAHREAVRLRRARQRGKVSFSSSSLHTRLRVSRLYQCLRDIHDACDAAGIQYWMGGETLWGAVTCHGLIPGREDVATIEVHVRDASKLARALSVHGYQAMRQSDGTVSVSMGAEPAVAHLIAASSSSPGELIRYPFGNFRAWGARTYAAQLRARYGNGWKTAFVAPVDGLPARPFHNTHSRSAR